MKIISLVALLFILNDFSLAIFHKPNMPQQTKKDHDAKKRRKHRHRSSYFMRKVSKYGQRVIEFGKPKFYTKFSTDQLEIHSPLIKNSYRMKYG